MSRYTISIETNEQSIDSGFAFSNKAEAKKQALQMRRGEKTRGEFTERENAHVSVYDNKLQVEVYCKPIYRYALKK